MAESKKEAKRKSLKIGKKEAQKQWDLFADEYSLGDLKGKPKNAHMAMMAEMEEAITRYIAAGWVEIVEDAEEGVIVKQHLKRPLKGHNEMYLLYKAPTPSQIAITRVGAADSGEMANAIKYKKLASAITEVDEPTMDRIKGPDRSCMEVIGSLFMRA